MVFLFAGLGLFVQLVFLLKRDWLFKRKTFGLIVVTSAALFILAYALRLSDIGNHKMVRILTVPLMTTMILYAIKFFFFRLFNRNPEDTFWSMDSNQMSDGVFNFFFLVMGTVLPVLAAYKVLP